jgi:hypothetical protein
LAFERVAHLGLLVSGESAVPQVLLKNGVNYIIPDFYSPSENRLIEVKWGGDGPGIAKALSKGNYYRNSPETKHLPEEAPAYLLVHHIENKSLEQFTDHGIEVLQFNSSAVTNSGGIAGVSPEEDAGCCVQLLMASMESGMQGSREEAIQSLKLVRMAAETIIAKRLGLDNGADYKELRHEDFVKACNNKAGDEELALAQRFIQGATDEIVLLPVDKFVYLADADKFVPSPVDLEAKYLLESTGLDKVRKQLDLLNSGSSSEGSLFNVFKAFNAVPVRSFEKSTEEFAMAMAAAEGVAKVLSSQCAFDSIPNLSKSEGIAGLGSYVRKWQAASDFVRGGVFKNTKFREELSRFSRTCIVVQRAIGVGRLKLDRAGIEAITSDPDLQAIVTNSQFDYGDLHPYMGDLLRKQGLKIADWSLENVPTVAELTIMFKCHEIAIAAAQLSEWYPDRPSKKQRADFINNAMEFYVNLEKNSHMVMSSVVLDHSLINQKEEKAFKLHPFRNKILTISVDALATDRSSISDWAKDCFQGKGFSKGLVKDAPKICLEAMCWSHFRIASYMLEEPMSLREKVSTSFEPTKKVNDIIDKFRPKFS